MARELVEYQSAPLRSNDGLTYGERVALILGVSAGQVAKTLVVDCGTELMLVIAPADREVSLKQLARTCGVKKVHLASPAQVLKATGYRPGGVSPFLRGKPPIKTWIDSSLAHYDAIYVSAGRPGAAFRVSAQELANETAARFVELTGN